MGNKSRIILGAVIFSVGIILCLKSSVQSAAFHDIIEELFIEVAREDASSATYTPTCFNSFRQYNQGSIHPLDPVIPPIDHTRPPDPPTTMPSPPMDLHTMPGATPRPADDWGDLFRTDEMME